MAKNDFKEYICRPYCIYFKDGQKEELTCQGARVMERLVQRKRIDMMKMSPPAKKPELWKKHKEALGGYICSQCPFRAEDCDFQSPEPSEEMEPCGGFILVAHLKESKLINESDLEAVM